MSLLLQTSIQITRLINTLIRPWLFIYTLLIGHVSIAWAQTATPLRNVHDFEALPPSPTVAALGTYGTIPVSYHTGIPDISVPLYTMALKGLNIPIALTYHSTGLMVDERASNVGFGWSCTAMSVIGHTIMGGISDFANHGYCAGAEFRTFPSLPFTADASTGSFLDYTDDVLRRLVDVEPDIYTYNIPGHSGKFVFDKQRIAHSIPYESLKIQHFGQIAPGQAEYFTITDESGNAFTFKDYELSETITESNSPTGCVGSQDGLLSHMMDGPTGYFLSQLITPYRDTVTFSYQTIEEQYNNALDLTEYALAYTDGQGSCAPIPASHNCITKTSHLTQVLTRIAHRGEVIEFVYDTVRHDMHGGVTLQSIKVKYGGVTQKEFILYHSYFEAAPTPNNVTNLVLAPADFKRLRLDSVRQVGMPAYRFAYNLPGGQSFPPVHSFAQDVWGYYNGKDANPTLVRRINNLGANRDSDSTSVKLGMLQQITYPTGGTSTFTYEANSLYHERQTLDELENISGLYVRSPDRTTVRKDTSFTITGDPRRVSIIFYFPNSSTQLTDGSASITLSNAAGTVLYSASPGTTTNNTSPIILNLKAGTYYLSGEATGGFTPDGDVEYWAQLLIQANKVIPAGIQPVAGCRIKQIVTNGYTPYSTVGRITYRYTDSLGIPTSYLLHEPGLTSHMQAVNTQASGAIALCTYTVFSQSSVNQIGLINGSPVAYTSVAVFTGPLNKAATYKSVYHYNRVLDTGANSDVYPFPPPDSYDWLRGKLVREVDYRYDGTTYQPVRDKRYTYQANLALDGATPYPNQAVVTGYRVFTTSGSVSSTTLATAYEVHVNVVFPYHYYSASVYLTKTVETVYSATQQPSTTVKLFDYNAQNLLVQRERTLNSQGDTLVKYTHYHLTPTLPSNTANTALRAFRWRQQHHVINQPVEVTNYLLRAGQPPLALQRSLKLPQLVDSMGLPLREYFSLGGQGVKVPISYETLTGDSLVYDASYYPLVAHQRYDRWGNILQQTLPSGRPAAYQYGYRQHLLTAHAVNAAYRQIAGTSFEEEATGRWRYDSTGTHRVLGGWTGHWAYLLDGQASITRAQLPAGDYDLTYWVQGGGTPILTLSGGQQLLSGSQVIANTQANWRCYHTRLHFSTLGQIKLDVSAGSISLRVDEIRLAPVGAQLTTYTYDPLVGITSQTGPDGRTVFYEYDSLQRLVRTRDEQGRILSQQQYHYAGQ